MIMFEIAAIPTMAEVLVQHPAHPKTPAQARARFFNATSAVSPPLKDVPVALFTEEPALAFHPTTPTGLIACDLSMEMDTAIPTTSPLMLAQYARINPSDSLSTDFAASGSLWYVISGTGSSGDGHEAILWVDGDIFILPGGRHQHRAGKGGAVLWLVSDAPRFAFEGITGSSSATSMVHYPATELRRQLDLATRTTTTNEAASILLSSAAQEANRSALPSLSIELCSLPAGQSQPTHRHNAAAVTLLLQSALCYTMIGDRRLDWHTYATMIIPPGTDHSVHNHGRTPALSLTVEDAGLHRYTRTEGVVLS
jgi:gentisate 1,2-dioxygenase